jgi:outer membrane lipoprotein-sorting protein
MKKLLVLIVGFLAMGQLLAQELTADEIISKVLNAIGQEKFMNIQTVKITGKMIQGGMEFNLTVYQKKPDFNRIDMEIQGMTIIMATDGKTGWTINPMTGSSDPQDLPEETIKSMKEGDFSDPELNWDNPFSNWREKGTIAELTGKEEIDGTPVYNLKLTYMNNKIVSYTVDASKFLVLRLRSTVTEQGMTYDQEVRNSDFRDFEGIIYSGKSEILMNGQVGQTVTINKCEFDVPIDDSVFKKPVKN